MADRQATLTNESRIGIVNRGEPAVRFIRAVRDYNEAHGTRLQAVAFFLDEEADAVFVREADIALPFRTVSGATQAGSVYLDHDVLLSALSAAGCDAVWPGWGFVSEDAGFVEKVERNGMVFLGPDARSMALLGDKIAAKELAERSQVPILPWSKRAIRDLDDAREISQEIGYPVIVKAAHAGGGRGIRFVPTPDELASQYQSAVDETKRITGDTVVFIERLVVTGRHLEVQCVADGAGEVVTFGVRDCSVQRRNQKIIEETPPPNLDPAIPREAEEAASRLLAAVGYRSAGTVEFLYDVERGEFYFMEVNTRLQVEHPITEQRYGVDLVQAQIDVGFGRPLPERQEPRGVVVEARLNAEDAERDFAPAPGPVRFVRMPSGPGVRVDSGIEQNTSIPSLFDSMVAKIIASGADRPAALARLRRALGETRIAIDGGTTNKAFLIELLRTPALRAGGVHTQWVEAYLGERDTHGERRLATVALLAASIGAYLQREAGDQLLFRRQVESLGFPRAVGVGGPVTAAFSYLGNSYQFEVQRLGPVTYRLQPLVDDEDARGPIVLSYRERDGESQLVLGSRRYSVQMIPRGDLLQCEVDGVPHLLGVNSGGAVSAPSPAVVLSCLVEPGQPVVKGQRLVTLEAMKMEMIVEAPAAGVVRSVEVVLGQQVASGEALVTIERAGEETETTSRGESLSFALDGARPDQEESLATALMGLVLGYDVPYNPRTLVDMVVELAHGSDADRSAPASLLVDVLTAYVAVDTLFCDQRISAEQFARTVTWEELIFVAFRYRMFGSDALPQQFSEAFERARRYYPDAEPVEPWGALYHMYRAQRNRSEKDEVLRSLLVAMENMHLPQEAGEPMVRLLDEVAQLNHTRNHSLADAAQHARYQLHDRYLLITVRRRRRRRAVERFRAVRDEDRSAPAVAEQEQALVDAGPQIVYELINQYRTGEEHDRNLALELLARRSVRDRTLTAFALRRTESGDPIAVVTADGITTIAAIVEPSRATGEFMKSVASLQSGVTAPEILLLAAGCVGAEAETLFSTAQETALPVSWLAVGVYEPEVGYRYRTFGHVHGAWGELAGYHEFSPIFYRELRIARLSNFTTRVLYHSDNVHLVHAVARSNPKDERLFTLAAAGEAAAQIDEENTISRVSEFDEVFMESVFKMRNEQARRARRLLWNRMIVHVRALMGTTAEQIKGYGQRLIPLTKDLGIEKAVVYTRRKRWSEDVVRELELLFLNVSEDQFTLRSRKPSCEPLKPMDAYVSNVVRSRQRNNIYPYELIRMVTYTGYPVTLEVPRGEFEEFDLADAADSSRAVSVRGRPYGRNVSNIVFGLIRNHDPITGGSFQRVLILSDSTRDLGSLAEPECRRVIAALDLAAQLSLPVEWIPISSGARIDMESGTENLDWTAAALRRIIEFTQAGGEINIVVTGVNVGAQSYWNAEATMLMHTRGLLIMTDESSMLLTGKRALDFSGSVSADSNVGIGGVERIMGPNGESQFRVESIAEAYRILLRHYGYTYRQPDEAGVRRIVTADPADRDVGTVVYEDRLGQGFGTIADIFSSTHNGERKKPFDMRQVMEALIDTDAGFIERWAGMKDAETAITYETRLGGFGVGLVGIESRNLARVGDIPPDGPEVYSGGTLFPQSSKKVARAINSWSSRVPVVVLANLSGFDGSPESLRRLQLEYGAEIGRAVVNFNGPLLFVVMARYHGGAYVVFSKTLNESLRVFALEGSFASVLGGAPAAAVVFPRVVKQRTEADPRVAEARERLSTNGLTQREYDDLHRTVYAQKQNQLAAEFDRIHDIERALEVGSIDEIVSVRTLRARLVAELERLS